MLLFIYILAIPYILHFILILVTFIILVIKSLILGSGCGHSSRINMIHIITVYFSVGNVNNNPLLLVGFLIHSYSLTWV